MHRSQVYDNDVLYVPHIHMNMVLNCLRRRLLGNTELNLGLKMALGKAMLKLKSSHRHTPLDFAQLTGRGVILVG